MDETVWLTTDPGSGAPLTMRWPDPDGPYLLSIYLAMKEGRSVIVGLHIDSFQEFPGPTLPTDRRFRLAPSRRPIGDLAEITGEALRSLRISEIGDIARRSITAHYAQRIATTSGDPEDVARHNAWFEERLNMLTSWGKPRKRRPAADEDVLAHVAELYREAMTGTVADPRKPAKYVAEQLRAEGATLDGAAVRKLIQRARVKGLLPPTTERRPGSAATTLPKGKASDGEEN